MKYFLLSHILTLIGLAAAFLWGGGKGMLVALMLMLMEISLSFDNAVVNAGVLQQLEEKWRKRFLTWGILIAVFGMRLIFPVVFIAAATELDVVEVTRLAFTDPKSYGLYMEHAHVAIASFGGMFLLLVFLHFMFDEAKSVHWLRPLERVLIRLGSIESIEIIVALCVLLGMQSVVPDGKQVDAMVSGVVGVVVYVLIRSVTSVLGTRTGSYVGALGFIYLQLLDASFSLDGVVGAFAISHDLILIMIGLGIGAMFVRSMTLYLVSRNTLSEYVYLEHGAHYGIGALALIMLVDMVYEVPDVIAGLSGVLLIGLSLLSSIRYRRGKRSL